jgi:hypothetical protein
MRVWSKAVLTMTVVALVAYGLDRTMPFLGVSRRELLFASDLLIGCVAACMFVLMTRLSEQRQLFSPAVFAFAEMNHHVRNALQVISFHSRSAANDEAIKAIDHAVARITWALREVLTAEMARGESASARRLQTMAQSDMAADYVPVPGFEDILDWQLQIDVGATTGRSRQFCTPTEWVQSLMRSRRTGYTVGRSRRSRPPSRSKQLSERRRYRA